jgi:hypothetical protein
LLERIRLFPTSSEEKREWHAREGTKLGPGPLLDFGVQRPEHLGDDVVRVARIARGELLYCLREQVVTDEVACGLSEEAEYEASHELVEVGATRFCVPVQFTRTVETYRKW